MARDTIRPMVCDDGLCLVELEAYREALRAYRKGLLPHEPKHPRICREPATLSLIHI